MNRDSPRDAGRNTGVVTITEFRIDVGDFCHTLPIDNSKFLKNIECLVGHDGLEPPTHTL